MLEMVMNGLMGFVAVLLLSPFYLFVEGCFYIRALKSRAAGVAPVSFQDWLSFNQCVAIFPAGFTWVVVVAVSGDIALGFCSGLIAQMWALRMLEEEGVFHILLIRTAQKSWRTKTWMVVHPQAEANVDPRVEQWVREELRQRQLTHRELFGDEVYRYTMDGEPFGFTGCTYSNEERAVIRAVIAVVERVVISHPDDSDAVQDRLSELRSISADKPNPL